MSPLKHIALLKSAQALLEQRSACALDAFTTAEMSGAEPDKCAAGRWMAHMLRGDFSAAWRESDSIRSRRTPDPHRLWDGQPLDGRRVIVRCLHGLGDAIHFLRYVSRLRGIASDLYIEVPPSLFEFAVYIDGVDQVVTWGEEAPTEPIPWDSQIEVMELPYIFRTEIPDLPIAEEYVHLPPAHHNRIAQSMGKWVNPRIGLVWAAGDWNPTRSIPLALFNPLIAQSSCEFWNLQGGSARTDWRSLTKSDQLRDSADFGDGILTLAAVISQLDLVITVDTLAAHLAGAMGIPAWVLIEYACDWRWLASGNSSPWYPSLRLFRQKRQGDWTTPIEELQQELDKWTQRRTCKLQIA